jgi:hypothetical protein
MKLLALVVALVCIALAICYWFGVLQLGASTPGPHHKHALVFAAIAVVALLFSRFQSGAATPNAR